MPERFGSQSAQVPAASTVVTVSPGIGSSGFSSRSLVFGDSVGALTNNSSGPTWNTTQGFLGIGTTAPDQLLTLKPASSFTIHAISGVPPMNVLFERFNSDVNGPSLTFQKARGTTAAPASVSPGDRVAEWIWNGYQGTTWSGVANMTIYVGSTNTTHLGGRMEWGMYSTSGAFQTNIALNSSGHVGIGTTAPTNQLHVLGGLTVEGSGAAGGFNFRRGAVSSGIAGTLQFQGQDISATTDGMTYASVQGFITVASTSVPQSELRFRVSNASSNLTQAMTLNSSGDLGVGTSAPASRVHVLTSVNGNAFRVDATTGSTSGLSTAQPAFNVQSTGSTSKVGFWTTVGATRGAAYTTSGSTATRTVPTTVTTGTQTTVQVKEVQNAVNGLIAVVNNLVADFQGFGLVG